MTPNFGAQMDVGKGTVGRELDVVVDEGAEGSDEVCGVVVELGVAGDGASSITEDEFFLRTPDLLTAFVDNGVLVGVDLVGEGTGRGGPEVREELVLGVERDDGEGELLEDGSGRGGRGDDSDGGFNDCGREIFNWDVRERDTVDDFLELEMDVSVLCFVGGGVLKLRA